MNNIADRIGYGASGAKMILIGEHAVVYQNPAIAMPFNGLKTEVSIYKTTEELTITSSYHNGYLKDGAPTINGVMSLIYHILEHLGKTPHGLHFEITSNITGQRGLGSSAAVAVAITKALYDAFDLDLSKAKLIELATFAEKIHHTNPSGIDVNVLVHQKPIWFERNKGFKFIEIDFDGTMMIIDSGIPSQTRLAVEHVAMLHETKTLMVDNNFKVLSDLTKLSLGALKQNDPETLGIIMDKAQIALSNIEVSSSELDTLILKTKSLGVLGAKLTGGGVGGCIIALTKNTADAIIIKNKLTKDGIMNVWISPLKDLS